VRTTSYSLPDHLHEHVDVVQPTTTFGRFRTDRVISHLSPIAPGELLPSSGTVAIQVPSGSTVQVDPSCNTTVTVTCLKQLYNAVGFNASGTNGNTIGITGYLEQFANIQDLQQFFAEQRPDAVNSTFEVQLINGTHVPCAVVPA